jgi:hypothetical protein
MLDASDSVELPLVLVRVLVDILDSVVALRGSLDSTIFDVFIEVCINPDADQSTR